MDADDTFYACLLTCCVGFGYFYRQIKHKQQKKWIGTSVGLLIAVTVSRFHSWQFLLMFLVNAGIILWLPPSHCHLASLAFSFPYLLFIQTTTHFGIPYLPTQINVIQMMMTLKLVGLAFDVNSVYLSKKDKSQKTPEQVLQDENNDINPTFLEMFHYTFNYTGILTGPYCRYKTFRDFFELPFSNNVPWNEQTVKKLTYVPFYIALLILSSNIWPISYALSDEFYNDRSWLYRFWYAWPTFLTFRVRLYAGMILTESIYTMVGLGAYPCVTEPRAGHGPSKCFEEMKAIVKNPERLATEKYSFETIRIMNPYNADFCTTIREGMKNWNMCIQYWLVVNVYKRFPNKQLRTCATMLTSAFWHGPCTGYYVCIGLVPFYLAVEDVYVKLFVTNNKGLSLKVWKWILWLFKMQVLSCLSIAFQLLVFKEVVRYYNSTYYCGFIIGAVLYLTGLLLLKIKKAKLKIKIIQEKVCK